MFRQRTFHRPWYPAATQLGYESLSITTGKHLAARDIAQFPEHHLKVGQVPRKKVKVVSQVKAVYQKTLFKSLAAVMLTKYEP